MAFEIKHGDCLEVMRGMADNSVDAIVTDPPYGLSFMGKKWDYDVPSVEVWAECLRVLKPGGHLLAFAGTRTQHRMAVRIEDAGFEIRDMIAWVYGTGFPKSLDVSKAIDKMAGAEPIDLGPSPNWRESKRDNGQSMGSVPNEARITAPATEAARQWQGWGTALKPSLEPVTVARKPLEGTVAENVLEHGTGALNIDGCRVGTEPPAPRNAPKKIIRGGRFHAAAEAEAEMSHYNPTQGRWPANLIHDGSEEVVVCFPVTTSGKDKNPAKASSSGFTRHGTRSEEVNYGDTGSAARFFYAAKCSKRDRDSGLDLQVHVSIFTACDTSETQGEELARLLVDTATSPPRVTAAYGAGKKGATEWSMSLLGKALTDQFRPECKSTISTATSSTIASQILNALVRYITNASMEGVSLGMASGGSHAASVENSSEQIITIDEKTALALGVESAALPTRLRISVSAKGNIHSTVKPTELMRYLVRLVTQPGGTVLDPFTGSGSTGKAAVLEGFEFIGIEREAEYVAIAEARIAEAQRQLGLFA